MKKKQTNLNNKKLVLVMTKEKYSGFTDLSYKPGKNDLNCEFKLMPRTGVSFEVACNAIASESSIGTWTEISTMKKRIYEKLRPRIYYLNEKERICKIAYPIELFEKGNIPQLMSSVAGNIFGMNALQSLRLEDIDFPDSYIKSFDGPRFGVPGIRKLLKVKSRPLLGTIIKPKIGLNEKEHAQVAFNAWVGGCDIVKDDENLTSQSFNHFEKRIKETLKMRDKAEKITGEKKVYMPNITHETNEMLQRMKFVKQQGGEYVMLDILTLGFSALQTVRNENKELGLVLHAHRAMHAALTRNPEHGISMLVIAKLMRLIGLDQLHIGTIVGKMQGSKIEVQELEQEIEKRLVKENARAHALEENWLHLKPMLAVCSGGLHPGHIPKLMKYLGNNIAIQMGGGLHGNKLGTLQGAVAARQAIEAVMQGQTLFEYAKNHSELKSTIHQFGIK